EDVGLADGRARRGRDRFSPLGSQDLPGSNERPQTALHLDMERLALAEEDGTALGRFTGGFTGEAHVGADGGLEAVVRGDARQEIAQVQGIRVAGEEGGEGEGQERPPRGPGRYGQERGGPPRHDPATRGAP